MLDLHAFGARRSDVNLALPDSDRTALIILWPVGRGDHGSRAVRWYDDHGVGHAPMLGVIDPDLNAWFEVALHNCRNRLLVEQLGVEFCRPLRLASFVVHPENEISAAMIGQSRDVARQFGPDLGLRGVHPGFIFDAKVLASPGNKLRQI